MAEVNELKTTLPALEAEAKSRRGGAEQGAGATIPNVPLDEVPDGADEHGNVEHHKYGAKRNYAFTPKQHFELGEALGMMDFETAAKLSGARFVVLKGALARLERALGQFLLDLHTGEHGYTEVNPPLLVQQRHACSAPRNCRSSPRISFARRADLWLIPTAEVPLTNLVREAIVDDAAIAACGSPPARRASAPRPAPPAATPAA